MRALHERNEKDKATHAIEVADLRRTIDHDEKVTSQITQNDIYVHDTFGCQ